MSILQLCDAPPHGRRSHITIVVLEFSVCELQCRWEVGPVPFPLSPGRSETELDPVTRGPIGRLGRFYVGAGEIPPHLGPRLFYSSTVNSWKGWCCVAPEKSQQDAFLAAVTAKIAAWTAVAETYRIAVSLDGPLSEPGGIVTAVGTIGGTSRAQGYSQGDLPVGIFRDKSLKDAIPIYLGAVRRKQTNKEIATGLQAGGFPTTSGNFESTVATALYRLKNDAVLLRFPDGWDLASSYPDSLRGRLEKDAKPRPVKARRRAPRKAQARTRLPLTSDAADGEAVG